MTRYQLKRNFLEVYLLFKQFSLFDGVYGSYMAFLESLYRKSTRGVWDLVLWGECLDRVAFYVSSRCVRFRCSVSSIHRSSRKTPNIENQVAEGWAPALFGGFVGALCLFASAEKCFLVIVLLEYSVRTTDSLLLNSYLSLGFWSLVLLDIWTRWLHCCFHLLHVSSAFICCENFPIFAASEYLDLTSDLNTSWNTFEAMILSNSPRKLNLKSVGIKHAPYLHFYTS